MLRLSIVLFISVCALTLHAQLNPLEQIVSVDADGIPLEEVLYQLIDKEDVKLVFSNSIIPPKIINLHISRKKLSIVLSKLFYHTDLIWKISGQLVIIKEEPFRKGSQSYIISGFILDETNGEPLVGASVYCRFLGMGTITNTYGFFSLKIPAGERQIDVSYLGFEPRKSIVKLRQDIRYNWTLNPSVRLSEVIVTADDSLPQFAPTVSSHQLSLSKIDLGPTLVGEKDVLRNIQLLPGIQTGADGVGGLSVRGGNASQNLVIIDGVPVFSTSHAAGILSIFDAQVLRSAKVIKGAFPARYGGRISSVIELRTKEGDSEKWSGWLGSSLATVNFGIEGPIVKGKSSIVLSGRKSFVGSYLRPQSIKLKKAKNDQGVSDYGFSDWNAKVNYHFSNKDKVYLNFYYGKDKFKDASATDQGFISFDGDSLVFSQKLVRVVDWENKVGGLRWNHLFSDRLFGNTSISYSELIAGLGVDFLDSLVKVDDLRRLEFDTYNGAFHSGITELGIKQDFDFVPHPNTYIRFGAEVKRRRFFSKFFGYDQDYTGGPDNIDLREEENQATSLSVYWEKDIEQKKWRINYGVRSSAHWVNGKSYFNLEPRLSASLNLGKHSHVQVAYSRMTQFVHLLSPTSIGLATDLWVPSTNRYQPQVADQVVLGFNYDFSQKYHFSVEAYYKKMQHLLNFSEGSVLFNDWKENVTAGEGRSKGLDFLFAASWNKLNINMAYSFAIADRKFEKINIGRRFPFKFDRRHDFKLSLFYKWKRIDFSANWIYGTGLGTTLPRAIYTVKLLNYVPIRELDALYYGTKNSYRMPAYHRLDIGVNYKFKTGRFSHQFGVGVYNLYNNRNPLYYQIRSRYIEQDVLEYYFVQVLIAPILPSINYLIKF